MDYTGITNQAIELAEKTSLSLSECTDALISVLNYSGIPENSVKKYFLAVAFSKHKMKFKKSNKHHLSNFKYY